MRKIRKRFPFKDNDTTARARNIPNKDDYWLNLESPSERRSRLRSIYILHSYALVSALGFSVVFTGVQPYLKRLTLLNDEKVND